MLEGVLGDTSQLDGKPDGKIATMRPAMQINQRLKFVVDD